MSSTLDRAGRVTPARSLVDNRWVPRHAPAILTLWFVIQVVLGLFFGHDYDSRIFMAAGHQVAAGENPYASADLSEAFHDPGFQAIPTIGYPPPWALMLGGIYRITLAAGSDLLMYRLAIKIPIILANVGLAYLTATCLLRLGAGLAAARAAWFWLLFNPFIWFASVAWGQFDAIVACLAMASLLLMDSMKLSASAALLALAISFKPTAFPLMVVPVFFLRPGGSANLLRFYLTLFLSLLVFCVGPFVLFRWDPGPILQHWNAHFSVGGGLSLLAALELIRNSYVLPGNWWLLGLIWIPALGIASLAVKPGKTDFRYLLRTSTALLMVFFLTRTWLSEPNLILIIPFVLLLTTVGELPRSWLHWTWILPLVFGVVNTSVTQLLYPGNPGLMNAILHRMDVFRSARLMAKVVVVVPWQILGWMMVVRLIKPTTPASEDDSLPAR